MTKAVCVPARDLWRHWGEPQPPTQAASLSHQTPVYWYYRHPTPTLQAIHLVSTVQILGTLFSILFTMCKWAGKLTEWQRHGAEFSDLLGSAQAPRLSSCVTRILQTLPSHLAFTRPHIALLSIIYRLCFWIKQIWGCHMAHGYINKQWTFVTASMKDDVFCHFLYVSTSTNNRSVQYLSAFIKSLWRLGVYRMSGLSGLVLSWSNRKFRHKQEVPKLWQKATSLPPRNEKYPLLTITM